MRRFTHDSHSHLDPLWGLPCCEETVRADTTQGEALRPATRKKPEHIWMRLLTNHTVCFFFLSHSLLLFLLLFLFPSLSSLISGPFPASFSRCHLSSAFNPSPNSTATDLQFARTSEGHPVPFATAGDCYSAAKCPQVCAGSLPRPGCWECN